MDIREKPKFNPFCKMLYNLTHLTLTLIKYDLLVGLELQNSVSTLFLKCFKNCG